MKIPVKLLTNDVGDNRVLIVRESIDPFRPKGDCKAHEEDGFDQDDGKLEMG